MSDSPQIAVIAEGAMARLEELRRVLVGQGFDARIVPPPDAKINA